MNTSQSYQFSTDISTSSLGGDHRISTFSPSFSPCYTTSHSVLPLSSPALFSISSPVDASAQPFVHCLQQRSFREMSSGSGGEVETSNLLCEMAGEEPDINTCPLNDLSLSPDETLLHPCKVSSTLTVVAASTPSIENSLGFIPLSVELHGEKNTSELFSGYDKLRHLGELIGGEKDVKDIKEREYRERECAVETKENGQIDQLGNSDGYSRRDRLQEVWRSILTEETHRNESVSTTNSTSRIMNKSSEYENTNGNSDCPENSMTSGNKSRSQSVPSCSSQFPPNNNNPCDFLFGTKDSLFAEDTSIDKYQLVESVSLQEDLSNGSCFSSSPISVSSLLCAPCASLKHNFPLDGVHNSHDFQLQPSLHHSHPPSMICKPNNQFASTSIPSRQVCSLDSAGRQQTFSKPITFSGNIAEEDKRSSTSEFQVDKSDLVQKPAILPPSFTSTEDEKRQEKVKLHLTLLAKTPETTADVTSSIQQTPQRNVSIDTHTYSVNVRPQLFALDDDEYVTEESIEGSCAVTNPSFRKVSLMADDQPQLFRIFEQVVMESEELTALQQLRQIVERSGLPQSDQESLNRNLEQREKILVRVLFFCSKLLKGNADVSKFLEGLKWHLASSTAATKERDPNHLRETDWWTDHEVEAVKTNLRSSSLDQLSNCERSTEVSETDDSPRDEDKSSRGGPPSDDDSSVLDDYRSSMKVDMPSPGSSPCLPLPTFSKQTLTTLSESCKQSGTGHSSQLSGAFRAVSTTKPEVTLTADTSASATNTAAANTTTTNTTAAAEDLIYSDPASASFLPTLLPPASTKPSYPFLHQSLYKQFSSLRLSPQCWPDFKHSLGTAALPNSSSDSVSFPSSFSYPFFPLPHMPPLASNSRVKADIKFVKAAEILANKYNTGFVAQYVPKSGYTITYCNVNHQNNDDNNKVKGAAGPTSGFTKDLPAYPNQARMTNSSSFLQQDQSQQQHQPPPGFHKYHSNTQHNHHEMQQQQHLQNLHGYQHQYETLLKSSPQLSRTHEADRHPASGTFYSPFNKALASETHKKPWASLQADMTKVQSHSSLPASKYCHSESTSYSSSSSILGSFSGSSSESRNSGDTSWPLENYSTDFPRQKVMGKLDKNTKASWKTALRLAAQAKAISPATVMKFEEESDLSREDFITAFHTIMLAINPSSHTTSSSASTTANHPNLSVMTGSRLEPLPDVTGKYEYARLSAKECKNDDAFLLENHSVKENAFFSFPYTASSSAMHCTPPSTAPRFSTSITPTSPTDAKKARGSENSQKASMIGDAPPGFETYGGKSNSCLISGQVVDWRESNNPPC